MFSITEIWFFQMRRILSPRDVLIHVIASSCQGRLISAQGQTLWTKSKVLHVWHWKRLFAWRNLESAKLRAPIAFVLDDPRTLRALVPYVLSCLTCLMRSCTYVSCAFIFSCWSCFVPYVLCCYLSPTCFRCFRPNICIVCHVSYLSCLMALVLLMCFRCLSYLSFLQPG